MREPDLHDVKCTDMRRSAWLYTKFNTVRLKLKWEKNMKKYKNTGTVDYPYHGATDGRYVGTRITGYTKVPGTRVVYS